MHTQTRQVCMSACVHPYRLWFDINNPMRGILSNLTLVGDLIQATPEKYLDKCLILGGVVSVPYP